MLDTQKAFSALSEEFVEVFMRHHPVEATRVGLHDYDDELPNDSPEGFQERAAWLRDIEQRLMASVPWQELPPEHRVDYALLRSRIATLRARLEDLHTPARDPVRFAETALHSVYLLLTRPFAPIEERKEHVLERLMAIPAYLEAASRNLKDVPSLQLDIVAEINAGGHAYVEDIVRTLSTRFPGERERIEHAGSRARVGFLQYQKTLDERVRPHATDRVGIGERWMNYLLEREHLLQMDCTALLEFGRDAVENTRQALQAAARRLDPTKTWQQQLAEAKHRHPEALRLREAYQAEVERARRFVEENRLVPMVDSPVEVVDTPRFERAVVPYATYLPPAAFDVEQTGYMYVTPIDTNRPREEQKLRLLGHNYGNMPLLVVHESYPGHHLQICHAHRNGSRLRRLAESPLLAEGWATYCEQLMDEHGFFLDPVSKLFRLSDHLWRACRVVLDVNLQCGNMTLAEASEFLEREALLEQPVAEAEARRYAITPTEPMSYLVGQSLLLETRSEAERRLGARFDLFRFHSELLACGTVPPTLLKDELWERLGVA